MGKATLLSTELLAKTKKSFMQRVLRNIRWKYASFAERYEIIEHDIDTIVELLEELDDTPYIGEIAKELLLYKNKDQMLQEEDIIWLCEILTVIEQESTTSLISVENYYILLEFLRVIPEYKEKLKEEIEKQCRQYTKNYPEALLIPAEELRALLLSSSLYYPEMDAEYIVQSLCGIIKLGVRFAELAEQDAVWEESFRKELCQIHSLNIHICLLLDDSELLYFLEEAESTVPSEIVTIIIQQLTLEEIYRKHGEESTVFSKISTLLSTISRSVYYGKYSPIFTLYNYMEYCEKEYKSLFALPLDFFVEIVTAITSIPNASSYIELSHALSYAEDIAYIFLQSKLNATMTRKQKHDLQQYLEMSKEELAQYRVDTKQEYIPNTAYLPLIQTAVYPEYSVIFSYIDDILHSDGTEYDSPSSNAESSALLHTLEIALDDKAKNGLVLLLDYIQNEGIVTRWTEEDNDDIIKLVQECYSVISLPASIFYTLLSDTIKKHHSLQDIRKILAYHATVINIARQEKLQICIAMGKDKESKKIHVSQGSKDIPASFYTTVYECPSTQIQ